jgi:ribosome modulation factor
MAEMRNFPARSIGDVDTMDSDAVLRGYRAGLVGGPEPQDRDEWHGWRNGMVDSGRRQPDENQRRVARQHKEQQ